MRLWLQQQLAPDLRRPLPERWRVPSGPWPATAVAASAQMSFAVATIHFVRRRWPYDSSRWSDHRREPAASSELKQFLIFISHQRHLPIDMIQSFVNNNGRWGKRVAITDENIGVSQLLGARVRTGPQSQRLCIQWPQWRNYCFFDGPVSHLRALSFSSATRKPGSGPQLIHECRRFTGRWLTKWK